MNEDNNRKAVRNDSVSVRELYQLIDQKIGQVNVSINRLETKFDGLEAGRLTSLEREVSTIQGKIMMIPLLVSSALGVFGFVVNYIFFNK